MSGLNNTPKNRIEIRRDALLKSDLFPMSQECPRHGTISSMNKCLRAFGSRLFDFYSDGFDLEIDKYQLEPSVSYPKEYVLDSILSQVSYDVDTLQKAYQQRSMPSLTSRLQTADSLAYLSLLPAIDNGILPTSSVLTYFHKSPNVRVIPYAPVAMVGIPFSAKEANNDYDLLATPHEIGHYVYRHGRVPNAPTQRLRTALENRIERSFPANQRWVLQWLEEIFADTYGCIVATKPMTESFMDILVSHSEKQFIGDTSKHPIPAVRMYVYTNALKKYGYCELAKHFECKWDKILEERGKPSEFMIDGLGTSVSFDEAKVVFGKVIDCLDELTSLDSLKRDQRSEKYPLWETPGQSFSGFVAEYSEDSYLAAIPALEIREEKELDNGQLQGKIYVNRSDVRDYTNRDLGNTNTWIDIINTDATLEAPIPPVAWSAIFDSLNWTEEGPHGRS